MRRFEFDMWFSLILRHFRQVMYVTALAPYLFMFILLINGVLQPGALDGIVFYLMPDFGRLADMMVYS